MNCSRCAAGIDHVVCYQPASLPFCISSFVAGIGDRRQEVWNFALVGSAVVRFDRHPCGCAGCEAYTGDLERLGRAPLVGNVEVRP